jgi:hypothetical protein
MNDPEKSWQKLLAAARRAPRAGDESAPFGFSTRVAALAFEQAPQASTYARVALRAAAVAGLLAVAAVAANYSAIMGAFDDDTAVAATDDPVAEVVDVGS